MPEPKTNHQTKRSLRPDGSVTVRVKVPIQKRKRDDLHASAPEWDFPSIHGLVESGEIWGWELESRTATHMVVRVIASSAKVNAVLRRQDVEAL